ncbi:FadR/GntR family transcriptional regulator [Pseudactinotalea sp. HY158]|uniref:FadR/GntR family transcriptional regulator n=1 Tax=Pseudactinotalea sp. HY158 TaxID=2654547 RepID=UPI00129D1FAD|nr:FCD domain-containing protein [Pseudactinotalea sp. HY158]QGH68381.1 GntR family transcriptional regulator [Pseudactinotalea sp. HY158]
MTEPAASPPLGRAAAKRETWSATDAIAELILAESLRPGDPIPTEAVLCERLGISRSSLREAIRTLASLDIVEVRHGHGTFVGGLSLSPLVRGLIFRARSDAADDLRTLREVLEVRIALDLAMADALAAEHAGTSDAVLTELVECMSAKADRGELFVDEDRAFHHRLLEKVDNTLITEMVTAFWTVHTVVQPYLGVAPGADIVETARAHGRMLEAVEAGDTAAYRRAVRAHYAPLERAVERAVEQTGV